MHHHHSSAPSSEAAPTPPVSLPSPRRGWIWWAWVLGLALVLLESLGCAHSGRASSPPEQAREALAKVGVAYHGLAALYEIAVAAQVEACKREGLREDASEAERVACMGPLGSQGDITLALVRARDLYDEGADLLAELGELLEVLEAALARYKGAP